MGRGGNERRQCEDGCCCCCCCWVTSVVSNSVRPHRRQPTRLPCPWDSPGKNTGVGCHLLLQCMKVKSESKVAQPCRTLKTPWTAAYQAPPSMRFSRQEYWRELPLPFPVIILVVSFYFYMFFSFLLFVLNLSASPVQEALRMCNSVWLLKVKL